MNCKGVLDTHIKTDHLAIYKKHNNKTVAENTSKSSKTTYKITQTFLNPRFKSIDIITTEARMSKGSWFSMEKTAL